LRHGPFDRIEERGRDLATGYIRSGPMRRHALLHTALAATGATVALVMACAHARSTRDSMSEPYADPSCGTRPISRVLAEDAGERRMRRPPPNGTPGAGGFTIKVDCESVGSTDLFLAQEDLLPGTAIRPHHHPHMDEILIIQSGSGVAVLDGKETAVSAGATIYIAPNTVVSLRNVGAAPLRLAFIFPHTGYGTYLREWSAPEGEPIRPLTQAEYATRLARARWLQLFEPD
jgi:mannose-6-phosphate isomerase-like protein (cupin superfamily)